MLNMHSGAGTDEYGSQRLVSVPVQLPEFLNTVFLITIDLAEQGASPVERKMGY
jgi:hypothetical protein